MLHAMGALETQRLMVQCRDRTGHSGFLGRWAQNQGKLGLIKELLLV